MASSKGAPAEEPTPTEPENTTPADPTTPDEATATPAADPATPGALPPIDVPVFAPAAAPAEEKPFVTSLPDWLADNYRTLVADENRHDSFTALADRSTGALAAWARHEAELAGEDITPTDAEPAGPDTTRGAEGQ